MNPTEDELDGSAGFAPREIRSAGVEAHLGGLGTGLAQDPLKIDDHHLAFGLAVCEMREGLVYRKRISILKWSGNELSPQHDLY